MASFARFTDGEHYMKGLTKGGVKRRMWGEPAVVQAMASFARFTDGEHNIKNLEKGGVKKGG
jgi:hypothetical protein